LDFDWINIEGSKNPIEANPRKWFFKHCFPPGSGEKVAFLGYARLAQGGLPQCSELLARYVAFFILATGERKLPKDYDVQAVNQGQLEKETFYSIPNANSLVDFAPFASSVARLIKCEPSIPRSLPRFIKFWTSPL
jgi:dimethylaniline monooxygenase (N-oxide forming)